MMDWIILDKLHHDWISILIFFNLFLLSYTKWRYDRKFLSFFKSIDPSVYFNNYGNNFFFSKLFGVNILIFSIATISLFLIFILYSLSLTNMILFEFLVLFSFLLSIGLISYFSYTFLGSLLGAKKEILVYNFNNLRLLFRISVFIFIIEFFHYFYFFDSFLFLRITFFCALMFYYFYSIVVIYNFLKSLKRGKFYFILYLCTLKTTPWVFIYWFIKYI